MRIMLSSYTLIESLKFRLESPKVTKREGKFATDNISTESLPPLHNEKVSKLHNFCQTFKKEK